MHEPEDLKGAGLKVTLPRIKVLEVFRSAKSRHLSAEEVYHRLAAQQADVGLATVYRVLTQLEEAGMLARNTFNAGKAVYELNEGRHHDHLICLVCGRTEEFVDATIERRQKAVAESLGYELVDHHLAMYGYCQACAAKRAKA
ncbi:MAG TPA: ferric iron uptake transcriptional regulator [Rhodocyclaceae bacterium]|nr:ferric iron uptake transcriptional regulator [Rhodocyclaceae bacterium]